MTTTARNEWTFYQIPHTGVPQPDLEGDYARTDTSIPIRREMNMAISNFGAKFIGSRMPSTQDYTRTQLVYKSKDELADWSVITEDGGAGGRTGLRSVTVENNPYVWGSTVKKVRDDQFFRMTMDHDSTGNGIEKPAFDVMDTDVASADGMNAYKNYPTEGWRSFGGKYDFMPYTGVLGRPRGNKRE